MASAWKRANLANLGGPYISAGAARAREESFGIPYGAPGYQTATSLSQLLANPINSSLFQAQINPMLANLVPSEARARTALTDRFRAAGGLKSSAFAQEASGQERDILQNRAGLIGNVARGTFSDLLAALRLALQSEQVGFAGRDQPPTHVGDVGGSAGFGGFGFSPETQSVLARNRAREEAERRRLERLPNVAYGTGGWDGGISSFDPYATPYDIYGGFGGSSGYIDPFSSADYQGLLDIGF